MRLFAKTPCSFGGKKYFIGQEIPAGEVIDPEAQQKMGVISIASDDGAPAALIPHVGEIKFKVPVSNGSETSVIDLTEAELVQAVGIMQKDVKAAVGEIKEAESESVLIFVNALDSRKSVVDATAKRAEELAGEVKADTAGDR